MAILEVNWNTASSSYLDNFVPFVVESLLREGAPAADAEESKVALKKHFGLDLPISVVKSIRKRAIGLGKALRGVNGSFLLADSARDRDRNINEEQTRLLRQQQNLVVALRLHVREHFAVEWTDKDSRSAIFAYVDRHASRLLSAATRGEPSPVWEVSQHVGTEEMVASFVKSLFEADAEKFEYFIQVVKGSMLASSMYLPAGSDRRSTFSDTTLYLDTPLLLGCLGYDGAVSFTAVTEMIALARSQGATIATFPHIVRETRGVLQGASNRLRFPATREPRRSVDNYFAAVGLTSSDVLAAAEAISEDLIAAGVEIHDTPGREQHFFSVSETDLNDAIVERVYYSRPENNGPQRDVDSITAVFRLRRGREGDRLETCRAVLVTTNRALVDVVKKYPDFARQGWPIAVHVDQVASMLWLKEPTSAPDLPRNQVVADCLALLTPRPSLWNDYMDRVDQLLERGELSEEQVLLMRSSIESQAALMAETRGGLEHVTDTTVLAVIARLEQGIQAPLRAELEMVSSEVQALKERTARDLAEADARDAEAKRLASAATQAEEQLALVERRLSGIAVIIAAVVRWTTMILVLALTMPYFLQSVVLENGATVIESLLPLISGAVAGVITVVASVWVPGRLLQETLARRLSVLLRRLFGVTGASSA